METRQWEGKTRGGRFGNLVFVRIIRAWGVVPAYILLAFVAVYFIPFSPSGTASVWRYSRKILHYGVLKSCIFLYRNYFAFGQSLIDRVAVNAGRSDQFRFEFENDYNPLAEIMKGHRPAIAIGAHVGSWSTGGSFFSEYTEMMNFVMYDNESRAVKEMMQENGAGENLKMIPVNADDLAHVFMISDALRRGECVCFMGDRYINSDKLLKTTFMGHEADFPMGPFLIAAKMKTEVVFYFSMRERNRTYKFRFETVAAEDYLSREKPVQYLLERYCDALGRVVEQYPEQWYNYYDFWKIEKKVSA